MKRLIMISLLLLAGCMPAVWVQEKGMQTMASLNCSFRIPEGWMKLNNKEFLSITREGLYLQVIMIKRMALGSPLQYTKKKLEKGMLPQEVADIIIDDIISSQDVQNFDLKENIPATLDGQAGFKITYSFKGGNGARHKAVFYGFLSGDWLYWIRYRAAERYYFDKDLKTFEEFVASFRLVKA